MAEVMKVDRLVALLHRCAGDGSNLVWIDPSHGLVVSSDLLSPASAIDFGRESIVDLAIDARRRRAPAFSQSTQSVGAMAQPHPAEAAPPPLTQEPRAGARRTGHFCLTLEGRMIHASSQKELLLAGLGAIEALRAGTLQKLSLEKSRTKRVAARSRDALNDNPTLAAKFSQQIAGGWWVFTNNSFPECQKFPLRAAWHAGVHARVEKLA